MTIWKFPLAVVDSQELSMPAGSTILCVQFQHDRPNVWALVPDSSRNGDEIKTIRTFVTGEVFDVPGPYIGTYQLGGHLVGHVFEEAL